MPNNVIIHQWNWNSGEVSLHLPTPPEWLKVKNLTRPSIFKAINPPSVSDFAIGSKERFGRHCFLFQGKHFPTEPDLVVPPRGTGNQCICFQRRPHRNKFKAALLCSLNSTTQLSTNKNDNCIAFVQNTSHYLRRMNGGYIQHRGWIVVTTVSERDPAQKSVWRRQRHS